jgi:hypothetical protein
MGVWYKCNETEAQRHMKNPGKKTIQKRVKKRKKQWGKQTSI